MGITIGFASNEQERQVIYRLRYEIYLEEMRFPYDADHERRLLTDGALTSARLLYARDEDEVVGTLRLQCGADTAFTAEDRRVYDLDRFAPVVPYEHMSIMSRFMTRPAYRNSSVPLALLQAMVQFYVDQGIRLAFLDCRPHLLNLYQGLGYRTYTKTYNDQVAGLLIPLVMVMDDLEHFARINSPFLPLLRQRIFQPSPLSELAALLTQSIQVQTVSSDSDQWTTLYGQLLTEQPERIAIFSGLSDDDVKRLLEKSPVIECHKGDRIISKDGPDNTVFIIIHGQVNVEFEGRVLTTESAGGVVGEVAFLLKIPRTASVIAAEDGVRVLALRQKLLDELITSESQVAARLLYNLSRIVAAKLVAGN